MVSIFKRLGSIIFSSSAPAREVESEEENESNERAVSETEERNGEQIGDAKLLAGDGLTDRMHVNGSGESLEDAGQEEVAALVKPKKTKSDTVSKKRKRNSKKVEKSRVEGPEPESHEAPAIVDAPFEDVEVGDLSLQLEQTKSKRPKKASERKAKRKSTEIPKEIEAQPQSDNGENLNDPAVVANLLNEASKRKKLFEPILPGMTPKSGTTLQPPAKSPQVVIIPRARTGLISAGEERADHSSRDLLPDDLSEHPQEVKKAKKRSKRTKKHNPEEPVASDINGNDSAPQPLVLAAVTLMQGIDDVGEEMNGIEGTTQAEIPMDAVFEGANDVPLSDRPSKKALGKRKASDSALRTTKKRTRKSQTSPNTDIRNFGTVNPSNEANAPRATSPGQRQLPAELMDAEGQIEGHTTSAVYSGKLNSVPAFDVLKEGRRHTPQFTPINQKLPSAKSSLGDHSSQKVAPSTSQLTQKAAPPQDSIQSKPQSHDHAHLNGTSGRQGEADSAAAHVEWNEPIATHDPVTVPPVARPRRRLPTGDLNTPTHTTTETPARVNKGIPKTPKMPKTPGTNRGQSTPKTTGKALTDAEIEEIVEVVESYQSQNGLEQSELVALIQGNAITNGENMRGFWNEVCSQVPDIPRGKVMSLCRRKYHSFIRGSWSEDQDDDLRIAFAHNPGKWTIIGPLLNRFPEDARLRWRDYVSLGDGQRKDVWDHEEEDRLRDCVNECLEILQEDKRTSTDKAYKAIDAESQIDWLKVSKMMDGTRSRLQCMNKWKGLKDREDTDVEDATMLGPIGEAEWRLTEAVNNATQMKPGDKLGLLRAIRDSAAGREGKIPWRAISAENAGRKGKPMTLKVCFRALRVKVPDHLEMKLQDIVAYLINAFEAAAPNEPRGFKGVNSTTIMSSQTSIKTKKQKTAKRFPIGEASDNGEGPSTAKSRGRKKSRQSHMTAAEDETPVPQRKKTVRERIEHDDPDGSLETASTNDTDDFGTELRSAWQTSLKTTPRAKKPIVIAKTSQRKKHPKSDVKIFDAEEGDDEPNRDTNSNEATPVGRDLETPDKSVFSDENGDTAPNRNNMHIDDIPDYSGDSNDSGHENKARSQTNLAEAQSDIHMENGMAAVVNSQKSGWSDYNEDIRGDVDQATHEPPQEDAESSTGDEEAARARKDIADDDFANVRVSGNNSDDESEADGHIPTNEETHSDDDVHNDPFHNLSGRPLSLPNGDRNYDGSDTSESEYGLNIFDDKENEDDDEHHITMNGFSRKGTVDSDAQSEDRDYDRLPNRLSSPSPPSVSSDDTTPSISAVAMTTQQKAQRRAREASIEL